MKDGVFHVIMAGGSGTRFWPLSRAGRPKQFLALVGEASLLRQAHDRAAAMAGADSVYIAAGLAQKETVLAAIPGLDPSRFIGEPCPRNTAPCVGLSALRLRRLDPEAVMVASPADHVYTRPDVLRQAIDAGVEAARGTRALVTLGIRPSRAETGYGYIEVGSLSTPGVHRVVRFVEKPDAGTAARYLRSGRFLWNSGVFVWRIGAILDAIRSCAPELWEGLGTIDAAMGGPDEEKVIERVFTSLRAVSIDHAVLEKASEVLVVPADPGWSDVGSWDAVAELHAADAAGNAVTGMAGARPEIVNVDSRDCFVAASPESGRSIALIGAENLVVVDTGDALLICRKGATQSVRKVVERLKASGRADLV